MSPEHEGQGEIVETKEEAFKKDPDRFVDTETLIVAVGRSDRGPTLFIKAHSRIELTNALGEVQVALTKKILEYDVAAKLKNKGIISPGGIMGFARKRFK